MKTERTDTPEKAREKNAAHIADTEREYGLIAIKQHKCPCENCRISAADSHYFATALIVVGVAVLQGRHTELYEVLNKFGREYLEDYPENLRDLLYAEADEFPEIICGAEEQIQ